MSSFSLSSLFFTLFLLFSLSLVCCTVTPDPSIDRNSHPVEAHHSFQAPFDKSQVYWNYGGSVVITQNMIRLTPATQDRRGWLWNEYPLEQENWQIEFGLEITSKPHFGGDGACMWVISGEQDPSTSADSLSGSIFGMRGDFKGFGLCIDVYDNDNRRNNPSIFVVRNQKGEATRFNHDNDYDDDLVRTRPETLSADTKSEYYKCVADVRNAGKPIHFLTKMQHNVFHVYVNTNDGIGYKFCLAVKLEDSYRDYHIAFTAATGQVADNHDIRYIATRYINANDKEFDDSQLTALNSASSGSSLHTLFWFVLTLGNGIALALVAYQFHLFKTLNAARIDMVKICSEVNQYVLPHYGIQAGVTMLSLVSAQWWPFMLNLPMLAYRAWEFKNKTFLFSPTTVAPAKGHGTGKVSVNTKLGISIGHYAVLLLFCLKELFF